MLDNIQEMSVDDSEIKNNDSENDSIEEKVDQLE